jgi:hypothetical protein
MGEYARLAHAGTCRYSAYGQTFQAFARGQRQRRFQNDGAGLLALGFTLSSQTR